MICTWPVDYTACKPSDVWTSLPASGVALYEEMATDYLWRFTGKQFGLCPATIRPCRQECFGEGAFPNYGSSSRSTMGGVQMTGTTSGYTIVEPDDGEYTVSHQTRLTFTLGSIGCARGCGDRCGCERTPALVFEKPVTAVTKVVIDGVTLDPSAYRVDNHRLLVRQDGEEWPLCQDMSKPAGEVGTWTVTVQTGTPVPAGGRVAAGRLAQEFAKAACGDKGCELPQRWQSITRQGISISAALDTFDGLDDGKTGIWLIDSWVASVTKTSGGEFSIASPDYRRTGRQTTWRA